MCTAAGQGSTSGQPANWEKCDAVAKLIANCPLQSKLTGQLLQLDMSTGRCVAEESFIETDPFLFHAIHKSLKPGYFYHMYCKIGQTFWAFSLHGSTAGDQKAFFFTDLLTYMPKVFKV